MVATELNNENVTKCTYDVWGIEFQCKQSETCKYMIGANDTPYM